MEVERRESMRVYTDKNIPVTLTCRNVLMTGSLYNISSSGISIEYEATCSLDPRVVVMITLNSGLGDNPWVDPISCIPIYEILTLTHDQNFSGKRMRQCGLVYIGLDPTQRNRIAHLLAGLAGHAIRCQAPWPTP